MATEGPILSLVWAQSAMHRLCSNRRAGSSECWQWTVSNGPLSPPCKLKFKINQTPQLISFPSVCSAVPIRCHLLACPLQSTPASHQDWADRMFRAFATGLGGPPAPQFSFGTSSEDGPNLSLGLGRGTGWEHYPSPKGTCMLFELKYPALCPSLQLTLGIPVAFSPPMRK